MHHIPALFFGEVASVAGKKKEESSAPKSNAKQVRVSQSDVPAYSLKDALRVAFAISENYASSPTKPLEVAAAMELAPNSSHFRMLTGSAIAYGLTSGGAKSVEIELTALGKRVVAPLVEGDDLAAKKEALLTPRVIGEFLRKYNNSPLPPPNIGGNVLESMGVPKERNSAVMELILDGAENLGLLREIKGKKYVDLERVSSPAGSAIDLDSADNGGGGEIEDVEGNAEGVGVEPPPADAPPTDKPLNRKVFITHGQNKKLVDPIKKLLSFGELEAVVSVEKQSVSQPVPEKVMNDMRSCGAAIIHVDAERVLMDKDAKEHVVLNPNVLIEIGAAMALYSKRFILLVKEGVSLPSNLQGLYEVRYRGDELGGDVTIKLLEAINVMKKSDGS